MVAPVAALAQHQTGFGDGVGVAVVAHDVLDGRCELVAVGRHVGEALLGVGDAPVALNVPRTLVLVVLDVVDPGDVQVGVVSVVAGIQAVLRLAVTVGLHQLVELGVARGEVAGGRPGVLDAARVVGCVLVERRGRVAPHIFLGDG